MDSKFSQKVKDILTYSKEEAIRLGNTHISPEHLFLGILREGEGFAVDILMNQGVDLVMLKGSVEKSIRVEEPVITNDNDILPLLKSTERVLKLVHLEARALKSDVIDTEHLLLAILKEENSFVTRYLSELNIDYQTVRQLTEKDNPAPRADFPHQEEDDDSGFQKGDSEIDAFDRRNLWFSWREQRGFWADKEAYRKGSA